MFSISIPKFNENLSQQKNYTETVAPLARTTSMSSCAGYHTPIEDEVAASELPSDFGRSISILNAQAPSPMSAVLTVSLEGYLDHQQISYGSPPSSDIAVRRGPSSEESYPVFSPLPTVNFVTQFSAHNYHTLNIEREAIFTIVWTAVSCKVLAIRMTTSHYAAFLKSLEDLKIR